MNKKVQKTLFGKSKDDWEAPDDFFEALDNAFQFQLDVAASKKNTKCAVYLTEEDDATKDDIEWSFMNWCNPPYGKKAIPFLQKGLSEAYKGRFTVFLLPARTDTKLWQQYVIPFALEVFFVPGRLTFKGAENPAPFPSALVVFGPNIKFALPLKGIEE